MRSEFDIRQFICEFARQDQRIRAVLLNGSRANPKIPPDSLQDFDVVFIVDNLETFTKDHSWVDIFGEKIIMQLPDEMNLGPGQGAKKIGFTYLMLFKDKNRIDLTLFPRDLLPSNFRLDSQTLLWLDKDQLFENLPAASDKDYLIRIPSEKEFLDTCNEFWWVSTYVVKGLLRRDIIYAKEMMETIVRPMLMKVLEWKVGIKHKFAVSIGAGSKLLKNYISKDFYAKILTTYSDAEISKNWEALRVMTELFQQTSHFVAETLVFGTNNLQEQNVLTYIKEQSALGQAKEREDLSNQWKKEN